MTEEKQLNWKKAIINEVLRLKEKELESLRNIQLEKLKDATDHQEQPKNLVEAKTDQVINEVDLRSGTLDKLAFQVEYLKSMTPEATFDKADVGAVVETDQRNFFVAVPQTEFSVDDKDFIGVSKESPIFQEMEGLKAGDQLSWNGTNYKIKAIY